MNEQAVRDVVEAWDAYTADRSNQQAAILFVLAMNKLREELAAPPAPSVADAKCMCSGLGPCEKLSNCRKAPSVADAHTCAKAVLDLRDMLLRLIKHEGMANDDATNKLYQKTTDALFAASRIKEGAPSVADAAGASEIRALIADDAYAMSFQTMGQYRSALLNAIKKETGK